MQTLYNRLKEHFPVTDFSVKRDDELAFVTIATDEVRLLLRHLRDEEGFTHLVLLTAVDWIEDGLFQLTYLLCNRAKRQDIGVRVMIPRDAASMASMHELWPTIATYQRELREMFGIDFPGSPGIEREFILEGWHDKPPYRRDFDTLAYVQETYRERPGRMSIDPAQHMKEQLYPDGK
jgi:NADH-quinone oxidoreductase subunit C